MKSKIRSKIKMPLKKIPKRKQSTLHEQINLCQDIGRIDFPNKLSALIVTSVQKGNEVTNSISSGPSGSQKLSNDSTSKVCSMSLPSSEQFAPVGRQKVSNSGRTISTVVPPLVSFVRHRSPSKCEVSTTIGKDSSPMAIVKSSSMINIDSPVMQSSTNQMDVTKMNFSSSNCSSDNMSDLQSTGITSISSSVNPVHSGMKLAWSLSGQSMMMNSDFPSSSTGSKPVNVDRIKTKNGNCQDSIIISSNAVNPSNAMPPTAYQQHLQIVNMKQSDDQPIKSNRSTTKSTITKILHLPNKKPKTTCGKSKICLKSSVNDVSLPIVHVRAPLLRPISPENNGRAMPPSKKSLLLLKKDSTAKSSGINKGRKNEGYQKNKQEPLMKKSKLSQKNQQNELHHQRNVEMSDDDDVIITGVMTLDDDLKSKNSQCKNNRLSCRQNELVLQSVSGLNRGIALSYMDMGKCFSQNSIGFIDNANGRVFLSQSSNVMKVMKGVNCKMELSSQDMIGDHWSGDDRQKSGLMKMSNQRGKLNLQNLKSFDNDECKKTNIGLLLGNMKSGHFSFANETGRTIKKVHCEDGIPMMAMYGEESHHTPGEFERFTIDKKNARRNESGTDSGSDGDDAVVRDLGEFLMLDGNKKPNVVRKHFKPVENFERVLKTQSKSDERLNGFLPFKINRNNLDENSNKNSIAGNGFEVMNIDESNINTVNFLNNQSSIDYHMTQPNHSTSNKNLPNDTTNEKHLLFHKNNENSTTDLCDCIANKQEMKYSTEFDSQSKDTDCYSQFNIDSSTTETHNSNRHSYYPKFHKDWKKYLIHNNDPSMLDTDKYSFASIITNKEKVLQNFLMDAGYLVKSDYMKKLENGLLSVQKRVYRKKNNAEDKMRDDHW